MMKLLEFIEGEVTLILEESVKHQQQIPHNIDRRQRLLQPVIYQKW